MNLKKYKQVRVAVALFVAATVSTAVTNNNRLLAVTGVLVGMLFMIIARSKTKIRIDEREKAVREKAAQYTYAIFAPTVGLASFLLFTFGRDHLYLVALGQVLAYLTLFLISLYALSYYYFNQKYGGRVDE